MLNFNEARGWTGRAAVLAAFAAATALAMPGAASAKPPVFNTVYAFNGPTDGSGAFDLTNVGGLFYGITVLGTATPNQGTIFTYNPATGAEAVLHAFTGAEGSNPQAGVLSTGGFLYGTNYSGGANSQGTVYQVDPASGSLTLLHSFAGTDGSSPRCGLTKVGAWLYGCTDYGGSANNGVIYKINPSSGAFKVAHDFAKDALFLPGATLVAYNGILYGATWNGGTTGNGALFAFDP